MQLFKWMKLDLLIGSFVEVIAALLSSLLAVTLIIAAAENINGQFQCRKGNQRRYTCGNVTLQTNSYLDKQRRSRTHFYILHSHTAIQFQIRDSYKNTDRMLKSPIKTINIQDRATK